MFNRFKDHHLRFSGQIEMYNNQIYHTGSSTGLPPVENLHSPFGNLSILVLLCAMVLGLSQPASKFLYKKKGIIHKIYKYISTWHKIQISTKSFFSNLLNTPVIHLKSWWNRYASTLILYFDFPTFNFYFKKGHEHPCN